MIDQKRIEAGARALDPKAWTGGDGSEFARRRQASMWEAGLVINAAFPELAGEHPTAWVAPMEATEAMVDGYDRRSRGSRPCKGIPPFTDSKGHRWDGAQNAWDAFRDAHLKVPR